MACLIRVSKRTGDETTKFGYVTHVYAPHCWVQRHGPTNRSVGLFLRTKNADKVLIVERRDDERVIRKAGFFHDSSNFGLAGEMWNVQLAFADRFDVRQRGPYQVLDAGILGGAYRSGGLLQFFRSVLLKIGYQEYAMRPCKC